MTIEQIQQAISNAENHVSNLSPEALAVPGFTSIKIRHLMNNLGRISTSFLEVGSHKGSTYCSAVFNNNHLASTVAIDSFVEFNNDDPMAELIANVAQFKPSEVPFKLIKNDWTSVWAKKEMPDVKFDFYFFDGDHSYESQRKSVSHFLDFMANEFIMCVDDYSTWEFVKRGTQDGLKDAGVKVLFERELYNGVPGDNWGWHQGLGLFLLQKQ